MRAPLFLFLTFALTAICSARPALVITSEDPALSAKNVYLTRNGKVRGTVYLGYGYSVPRSPHVHVYALDASNKIIHQSCDKINGTLLVRGPRFGQGAAPFFGDAPLNEGVATIKIVVHGENDECDQGPPFLDFSKLWKHSPKEVHYQGK